jgi:hypothetical protein
MSGELYDSSRITPPVRARERRATRRFLLERTRYHVYHVASAEDVRSMATGIPRSGFMATIARRNRKNGYARHDMGFFIW